MTNDVGRKYDTDKPRCGLVINGFARALYEICKVGEMGAQKYAPDNWLSLENGVARYTDALYRHLLAEATGDVTDTESELLHAAHAAWNTLARLELMLRHETFVTATKENVL